MKIQALYLNPHANKCPNLSERVLPLTPNTFVRRLNDLTEATESLAQMRKALLEQQKKTQLEDGKSLYGLS